MASKIRQNLHDEGEKRVNEQINWAIFASYCYKSKVAHFDRDDVALPGFKALFEKIGEEKYVQFLKMIDYLNRRGGRVVLQPIEKPPKQEWGSGLDGLNAALDMEKKLNQLCLEWHDLAQKQNDAEMCHFVQDHFLEEQRDRIKELGNLIQESKRAGTGLGEWHVDKMLLAKFQDAPKVKVDKQAKK